MYNLITVLNENLEEAFDSRQPMFKAVLVPADKGPNDGIRVIDVQTLPQKNLPMHVIRHLKPLFAKFGKPFHLNFETKDTGIFNTLTVMMTSEKDPSKTIKLDITQLTHTETPEVKRAIYLHNMNKD